jgi:hypothetical protein
MVGRQLAAAHEPSALHLPRRLRQVLDYLLEGDSEKQVAGRFGPTPPDGLPTFARNSSHIH